MALLGVEDLSISFGGLKAADNFQISIEKGQLYGLTGSNGAGRITIFNLLTGVYKPGVESIELAGVNITGRRATEISQAGIARTFQNTRLSGDLSVLDSVKTGFRNRYRYSTTVGIFRSSNYFKVKKQMDERAMELLKVFGLDGGRGHRASNLLYGKQRELEVARALAMESKLLLLDEPAVGVNPNETAEFMDTIRLVRDNLDMTILLIEHGTKLISGICEEPTVLNFGQVLRRGETGAVLHNPEIVKVYPGE